MAARKYDQCAFPSCDRNVLVSKLGLCPKHDDMFLFIIWAVKVMQSNNGGKTPSGLYLPKQSNVKKGG